MPVHYATVYGACLGLLSGAVITLLFNLGPADAAYRTMILAVGGGWMGMLLAWLHALLQPTGEAAPEKVGDQQT